MLIPKMYWDVRTEMHLQHRYCYTRLRSQLTATQCVPMVNTLISRQILLLEMSTVDVFD